MDRLKRWLLDCHGICKVLLVAVYLVVGLILGWIRASYDDKPVRDEQGNVIPYPPDGPTWNR